jgi:hypothetical protein
LQVLDLLKGHFSTSLSEELIQKILEIFPMLESKLWILSSSNCYPLSSVLFEILLEFGKHYSGNQLVSKTLKEVTMNLTLNNFNEKQQKLQNVMSYTFHSQIAKFAFEKKFFREDFISKLLSHEQVEVRLTSLQNIKFLANEFKKKKPKQLSFIF